MKPRNLIILWVAALILLVIAYASVEVLSGLGIGEGGRIIVKGVIGGFGGAIFASIAVFATIFYLMVKKRTKSNQQPPQNPSAGGPPQS